MTKNPSLAPDCLINVERLVESKLLVQANSGGGKSWTIRLLAEQTYGKVQQIIIDHDGEYHTLAEKFDYVIARKGGEAPADIKSAALLARRLLELGVSAIIDIYELGTQRAEFVRRLLDAITNSPRDLWHPCLVFIDEAHLYCPEKGSSIASEAVKQFMSLGRKRGFAGILATQRIAKLDKDAAAECNSKLIGRSALDVDMKRSADELGFSSKEDARSLRTLKPGQFYAFGPAFTDEVTLIQVGDVKTTHLRAGQRAMAPPAPREKVKKILAQLKDLPQEAEQEAKTIIELQAQVKQLRSALKKAESGAPAPVEKIVEKPAFKDSDFKQLDALCSKAFSVAEKLAPHLESFAAGAASLRAQVTSLQTFTLSQNRAPVRPIDPLIKGTAQQLRDRDRDRNRERVERSPSKGDPLHHQYVSHPPDDSGELPPGEQAVLRALIQFPKGLQRSQLTVLTGYARSSRDAYISRLKAKGLVEVNLVYVFATDAGIAAMPHAEPLPTGDALRDYWYRELPDGERNVLRILVDAYPDAVEKTSVDEQTGYARSSRDAYISRMRAKQLVVDVGRGAVKASEVLFEIDA